jgi:hypothetical protein
MKFPCSDLAERLCGCLSRDFESECLRRVSREAGLKNFKSFPKDGGYLSDAHSDYHGLMAYQSLRSRRSA